MEIVNIEMSILIKLICPFSVVSSENKNTNFYEQSKSKFLNGRENVQEYPDFFFYPHLKICLLILERGEGIGRDGERNIHVREKHQLAVSPMHSDQGPNPQPR